MTQPNAVKKLSAKTIVGDVKKLVREGQLTSGTVLYRVIGIADGVRSGESNFGPWTAFSGDFEAVNMLTGEVSRGPQFFSDKSFTDALLSRMNANPGAAVEFALEVAIEINDDYPMGFGYVTRPIVENAHDRLGALRSRLAALPAPDAPAKAPEASQEAEEAPADAPARKPRK